MHPLRFARLQKGWTQRHLGYLAGIAQITISYAERGYPALTKKQKLRLAKIFNCSEETLFPERCKPCDDSEGLCPTV